jgi:NAD(P)-dependent dehydrogenase (short-subunit alcohol dehydrogenase family)
VTEAGGQALAVPADVTDHAQLEKAATEIEAEFGPIDVWINVAFTSVFAPFAQITPDEFRRVTEVSYLGYVNGTMVALSRMRSRNAGTIVQVGSALSERAIPLQSAYCGAKHAINGFTESLRCELLHEHSNVRVTVAQMPAVNTPQFSWVLSRLPRHPRPVPPIYQPARPSRRACAVARVLGVRHLVQAGVTAAALRAEPGSPHALAGGAAVDALHACTMIGLALVDRGARRVAVADTGVEMALATAGGLTAIR